jgi:hypothetical protein
MPVNNYNYGYQYANSSDNYPKQQTNVAQLPEKDVETSPQKNKELSTAAKIGIAAGGLTALAVGIDFAFYKGVHIKKLLGKGGKGAKGGNGGKTGTPPTSPKPPENTPKPSQPSPAQKPSNDKIIDARRQIASKYGYNADNYSNDFSPKLLYSNILNKYYKAIRHPKIPYATRSTCNPNIENITKANASGVKALWENGWYYRIPVKRSRAPIVDRISLNVYPEDELIQKLDKFIANSGGTAEYKTSECYSRWNKRHDPITIYFHRNINKADEDEIVKLVSKHVRPSEEGSMLGRKISDGIYQVLEPKEKDVLALIDKAEKLGLDPKLIECLKAPGTFIGAGLYDTNSKGEIIVRTSPGLMEAAQRLVDDLAKLCA